MMNFNLDPDEIFRLLSFPSLDAYMSTLADEKNEALLLAEQNLLNLRYFIDIRLNEVNFSKLKQEFNISLISHQRDELQDFTTAEVAKILKRCDVTVRNYIRDGKLEGYRTANEDIRITRKALEKFMAALRNSN